MASSTGGLSHLAYSLYLELRFVCTLFLCANFLVLLAHNHPKTFSQTVGHQPEQVFLIHVARSSSATCPGHAHYRHPLVFILDIRG